MNIAAYFERLAYKGEQCATADALFSLHRQHVISVPFENLDIHLGRAIKLAIADIYNKVVQKFRGGFCYELNYLFNALLNQIGYKSHIISASIFDSKGQPGPMFDHMCLLIDMGDLYLADVGFGDLFLQPIKIEPGIQFDGRNYFKIEHYTNGDYLLSMSSNQKDFVKKYIFGTQPQVFAHFANQCHNKQTSPDSYFVQNKICTRATPDGRFTLFNDKFIATKNGDKMPYTIAGEHALNEILRDKFNIAV